MPLVVSTSRRAFLSNVRAEIRAGRKPPQALAIAYRIRRRAAALKAARTRRKRRRR